MYFCADIIIFNTTLNIIWEKERKRIPQYYAIIIWVHKNVSVVYKINKQFCLPLSVSRLLNFLDDNGNLLWKQTPCSTSSLFTITVWISCFDPRQFFQSHQYLAAVFTPSLYTYPKGLNRNNISIWLHSTSFMK